MRIDVDLSGVKRFSALTAGDVFLDSSADSESSGRFCMVFSKQTQLGENAIDLEFGILYIFEANDPVTLFEDACLVVKAKP